MILMNWTRSEDGGFTAFQVRVSRARLARFIQGQFADHMRSIYCHEQTALALYQGLAARTADSVRRDVFLRLAQAETRQIARRAEMLRRLNISIPCCGNWWGRLRQRALIWLGPRYALAWIKRIKNGDVRRQIELTRLLRTLSE